jgi:hypothetical protein
MYEFKLKIQSLLAVHFVKFENAKQYYQKIQKSHFVKKHKDSSYFFFL